MPFPIHSAGNAAARHVGNSSQIITHGEQLIPQGSVGVNVGPTALLGASGYPGNLEVMSLPGRGYWRGDTADEFAPTGDYVYNNTLTNKGGVVPAGGMTIDGYTIPAGTRVVQFRDFSAGDFYLSDSTNILWRGCRWRHINRAPGDFNCAGTHTGKIYWFFCDLGATGFADVDYNEIPIKIANATSAIAYRNYITRTSAGIQMNISSGGELTENWIGNLTYWYGDIGPPGEGGPKHLNGHTSNGGETCMLILRNHIAIQSPDENGRTINQTDCISFFQDFGTFPGNGTNRDGTTGYQVRDNYIGGTGYCIYAGKNAGSPSDSVNNMVVTGNKITTQWYSNGGANGPIAAEPVWGTLGNSKSNNVWADGPNQGQSAF